MQRLASLIAAEFDEGWYRADLASITGERSDDALAAWVDGVCLTHLGQRIVDAHFVSKSVGAVFGVTLADRRSVVLKLFHPSFDEGELRAIESCLRHVLGTGFPATKQVVPLFRIDGTWAAFYELASGHVLDAHRPEVRRTLARGLTELARSVDGWNACGLPLAPTRQSALWPPAHRVSIDLSVPGGEWIDARAVASQRLIRASDLPLMAAHTDWSVKNALFADDHRIAAILDWDSLMQASEAEMVGRAAAEFTVGSPQGSSTPSREEATAFVRAYEAARGRAFDAVEQRVINASADYLLAQVGRHGHTGPGCPDDSFRALLRETAEKPLVSFD